MFKKNILIILIIFLFLSGLLSSRTVFAVKESARTLKLKENYSHLLSFDEEIIRYRSGEKNAFEIEILPDIFNGRHEMIVKPLKELKTNLLVWTSTQVYNFDIEAESRGNIKKFFSFNNSRHNLSKGISSTLGEYEIDMPPYLQKNTQVNDFEIDLPPKAR